MSDADQLAAEFDRAQRIVFFTGAGISTESGIPDFRSPGGVWSKMKPIYFQEFVDSADMRRGTACSTEPRDGLALVRTSATAPLRG
jgi:NAD-dependent deacetylase